MKVLSQLSLAKRQRSTSPLRRSASASGVVDDQPGVTVGSQSRDSKSRVRSTESGSQRYTMATAGASATPGPDNMHRVCSLPYDSKVSRRTGKVDVYYNQDGTTLSTTSSTGRSSEDLASQTVPKRKAFRERFMKHKTRQEDVSKKTESFSTPTAIAPTMIEPEQKKRRKKTKEKKRRERALGKYALKIVACTHKAQDREFEQFLARQEQAGLDYQVVADVRRNGKPSKAVEYKAVSAASHQYASQSQPSSSSKTSTSSKRPNQPSQTNVTDRAQRELERQMMRDTLEEIELTLGNKFGYKLTQTEMVKHLSSVASSLNIPVERILADKTAAYEILQSHLLTTLRRAREDELGAYDSSSDTEGTATSQNALGSDDDADDDESSCSYGDSQSEFSKWAYELEDEESRAAASFVRELFSNLSGMTRSLNGSKAGTEEAILSPHDSVAMTMRSSTPKTQKCATSVTKDRSNRSASSTTLDSSAGANSNVTDRDRSAPLPPNRLRYSMEGIDMDSFAGGKYRTKATSRRKSPSTSTDGASSDSSAFTSDDDDDDVDSVAADMGGLAGAMQAAFRPILQNRWMACGDWDDFVSHAGYQPSCASYSYHCR